MKRLLAGIATVAMLVSFSACGASPDEQTPTGNTNVTNVTKIAVDGDTDNTVYEFNLSDGTKCVFVDGDQESGLACDFG